MQPSPQLLTLCNLRAELANVSLEDQKAFLRNCLETIGPAYRELQVKQRRLVDWIESEQ